MKGNEEICCQQTYSQMFKDRVNITDILLISLSYLIVKSTFTKPSHIMLNVYRGNT